MYDEIASGGMATVHFGRLLGAVGFSRTVAIKRLHPQYSRDPEFVSMFLDEARLATRIQHPNVTVPLDVVLLEETGEVFLVMEYIHGANLAHLLRGTLGMKTTVLPSISAAIMSGALHGLHSAHEAVSELGFPLNIVHRDVSPQNIMVGVDGVARVLDFGVAKAVSRCQSTREGQVKGKLAYMAPEQMGAGDIDRRADIFAAGIVLWEALTMQRLFKADDPGAIMFKVMNAPIMPPSSFNPLVSSALDRVVMKALDRNVRSRFQTAREFATAIEDAVPVAGSRKVGEWVAQVDSEDLAHRTSAVSQMESSSINALAQSGPPKLPPAGHRSGGDADAGASASGDEPKAPASAADHLSSPLLTPTDTFSPALARLLRRRGLVILGGSLLAIAVGVGLVGLISRARTGNVPSPASAAAISRSMVKQVPVAPPILPQMALPTTAPSSQPMAPAVSAATVVGEAKKRAPAPHRASSPKTVAPGLSRASGSHGQNNCDPPFIIDGKGIRRVKNECL
jgi:serine/threonine-protein kinase